MPRCAAFFFFNDTATTEIYTLSLHDALPIWLVGHAASGERFGRNARFASVGNGLAAAGMGVGGDFWRSEEHTAEVQSRTETRCRLLLAKKTKARGST